MDKSGILLRACPSTPLRDRPSTHHGPPFQAVDGVPTCHQKYPYATQPIGVKNRNFYPLFFENQILKTHVDNLYMYLLVKLYDLLRHQSC